MVQLLHQLFVVAHLRHIVFLVMHCLFVVVSITVAATYVGILCVKWLIRCAHLSTPQYSKMCGLQLLKFAALTVCAKIYDSQIF